MFSKSFENFYGLEKLWWSFNFMLQIVQSQFSFMFWSFFIPSDPKSHVPHEKVFLGRKKTEPFDKIIDKI